MRIPWLILLTLLTATSGLQANTIDSIPLFRVEQGKPVPFHLRDDTRYVAFYFSASWCPPCRTTTPALADEYHRMIARDAMPVEVILVGDDRTEKDMLAYIKRYDMPWPAVSWSSRQMLDGYAVQGIPHLALVDRKTGKLITAGTGASGEGSVESVVDRIRELTGDTDAEPFRTGNFLSRFGLIIAIAAATGIIFLIRSLRAR